MKVDFIALHRLAELEDGFKGEKRQRHSEYLEALQGALEKRNHTPLLTLLEADDSTEIPVYMHKCLAAVLRAGNGGRPPDLTAAMAARVFDDFQALCADLETRGSTKVLTEARDQLARKYGVSLDTIKNAIKAFETKRGTRRH